MPGVWQKKHCKRALFKKKFSTQLLILFLIEFFQPSLNTEVKLSLNVNAILHCFRKDPKSTLGQQKDTSVPNKFSTVSWSEAHETAFHLSNTDWLQLLTPKGNITLWLNFMPKCLVSIYQLSKSGWETQHLGPVCPSLQNIICPLEDLRKLFVALHT